MEQLIFSINNSLALTTLAALGSFLAVAFAIVRWFMEERIKAKTVEVNMASIKEETEESYRKVQVLLGQISTRPDVPLEVREAAEHANNEFKSSLSVVRKRISGE